MNNLAIYQGKNGEIQLKTDTAKETIWATQAQMAELFEVNPQAITRHLKHIYDEGELLRSSTCSKMEQVQIEGTRTISREVSYYNLDAMISVGYRVNSAKATQFRQWATKTLRQYITAGVAVNEHRLKQLKDLSELEKIMRLIQRTVAQNELEGSEATGILEVITKYASSWLLLQKYDESELQLPADLAKPSFELTLDYSWEAIGQLKTILMEEKQASEMFGNKRNNSFDSIVSNLYQSFGGEDLYKSIAEKAANLLYLIIKDHPFSDGNKRIGSFLFVIFLTKNNYNLTKNGEQKISDRTLVALALLIAESQPSEKEVMTTLVCNLLTGE
jgi:death-on-curing family protein